MATRARTLVLWILVIVSAFTAGNLAGFERGALYAYTQAHLTITNEWLALAEQNSSQLRPLIAERKLLDQEIGQLRDRSLQWWNPLLHLQLLVARPSSARTLLTIRGLIEAYGGLVRTTEILKRSGSPNWRSTE